MQETQVRSLSKEEKENGKGNGHTFQYSCLDKPMDRGAWLATVHRVAKSWTQLSNKHARMKVSPGRVSTVESPHSH